MKIRQDPSYHISEEQIATAQTICREANTYRELLKRMIDLTRDAMQDLCHDYLYGKLEVLKGQDETLCVQNWERQKIIHPVHLEEIDSLHSSLDTFNRQSIALTQVVLGGIDNIAWMTWDSLLVAPLTYHSQNGTLPTEDEYLKMGKSSLSLIECIASSERILFDYCIIPAISILSDAQSGENLPNNEMDWDPFDFQAFEIDSELRLDLKSHVARRALKIYSNRLRSEEINITEPRTGCPARFMFPPIHQWCLELAKHSLFKATESTARLPYQ